MCIRDRDITARLLDGETCAIVTDAGMPCISDPGEELVRGKYYHTPKVATYQKYGVTSKIVFL